MSKTLNVNMSETKTRDLCWLTLAYVDRCCVALQTQKYGIVSENTTLFGHKHNSRTLNPINSHSLLPIYPPHPRPHPYFIPTFAFTVVRILSLSPRYHYLYLHFSLYLYLYLYLYV